ncbi:MAG: response regulator transcription factor [Bacteriovoracaceae bacterium]
MVLETIVIIEDDSNLREMLKILFTNLKYQVFAYDSAESFFMSDKECDICVYIIDENLPGIPGHHIVTTIRKKDLVSPIFMISGEQNDQLKRESLLKGADDYLYKPFVADHLAIRIGNAVRRANIFLNARYDTGIKFIPQANTVVVHGKTITLSNREFKVLSYLMEHPLEIVTREDLVSSFKDNEITMRTIDVHISSLRRKLVGAELHIETYRGKGYMARYDADIKPTVISE